MSFTYSIPCFICGNYFFAKRKHAYTCSPRCRHTLHKLNADIIEFPLHLDYIPVKMLESQIDKKRQFVNHANMKDSNGNVFEFIYGYLDLNGNVVIAVFRNDILKYLMAWYDYGSNPVFHLLNLFNIIGHWVIASLYHQLNQAKMRQVISILFLTMPISHLKYGLLMYGN